MTQTAESPSSSVFRTKPIEDVIDQAGDEDMSEGGGHLRKRLGVLDLMGFGIGLVIGTGIFTLTGVEAKQHAGPGVVISFLIAGVISALAALCYAELSSAVPTAGSAYTYSYATMGELAAWIIGWDLLLEFMLGAAVVARGWSGYLQDLFHLPTAVFGESSTVNLGAVILLVVMGLVAALGIRQSSLVVNALVALKIGICIFVIVAGFFFIKGGNLTPFIPPSRPAPSAGGLSQPLIQSVFGVTPAVFGFAGVLTAAAVVFFAYTGFEAVANLGEETKNPGRDLPRGLIGTLAIATLLYAGVSFVVTGMVKYTSLNTGAPIADAFRSVGAPWAAGLVDAAAVAGLMSVTLVELVSLPRITFAMGRDGLLPRNVTGLNEKTGTPVVATAILVVCVAILAAFVPLTTLADLVSIGTLFAFVLVSVAVLVLRRTRPQMKRPFRVPWSPVLPALSAVACVYLMANLTVETWLRFVVWLAIGLALYFGYGRRKARLAE